MKKTVTICFRTSEEIRKALQGLAKADNRSLSSTIENMILDYIRERRELRQLGMERRRYSRKQVSIPAFIYEPVPDQRTFKSGTIIDISLGGIKISISKDLGADLYQSCESPHFDALFALPNESKPLTMRCKPCRVAGSNGDIHIGASFIDSDFHSFQSLQNYLVQ